jgi:hypothetical protein
MIKKFKVINNPEKEYQILSHIDSVSGALIQKQFSKYIKTLTITLWKDLLLEKRYSNM